MKKIIICVIVAMLLLCGCTRMSEADKVNSNMSKQADYFDCNRHIVVYNTRTDRIIFECEGLMSISNNNHNELIVTCKVGDGQYKKNYIYLGPNITYTVEDVTGTSTEPYRYVWYWHTNILPTIEVKP